MSQRIICLTATLLFGSVFFVSACSQNVPSNKGLTPTSTTTSFERSQSGPLTGTESELVEATVAVHAIDYGTRRLTVRNVNDQLETLVVAPEVKRFSDIKVGDRISYSYARSIAFEVRKPTPEEIANPSLLGIGVAKAPTNLPPGIAAATLKHTIVTVDQIDLNAKTVTVRKPDGEKLTVAARFPENLSRIKVGDTIAVTYGEAMIVDIRPLA